MELDKGKYQKITMDEMSNINGGWNKVIHQTQHEVPCPEGCSECEICFTTTYHITYEGSLTGWTYWTTNEKPDEEDER